MSDVTKRLSRIGGDEAQNLEVIDSFGMTMW